MKSRSYLRLHHRSFGIDCGITDPKITTPALLIMGAKDYVIKFPGIEDLIKSGQLKGIMPNLETNLMEEGTHFVNEQFPEQVNEFIITFLNKLNI